MSSLVVLRSSLGIADAASTNRVRVALYGAVVGLLSRRALGADGAVEIPCLWKLPPGSFLVN